MPIKNKSVLDEYESLSFKVDQLKIFLSPPAKTYPPNYPVGGSWNDKIIYILSNDEDIAFFGAATANELSFKIAQIESINEDSEQYKKLKSSVYATLSSSFKNGKYLREVTSGGDYYYSINPKHNEENILEP